MEVVYALAIGILGGSGVWLLLRPRTFQVLLGLTLLWGVGFAQDMRLHNGAHDTRHAIGFPCH